MGLAYVAFGIYANFFLMNCAYQVAQAAAPDAERIAFFEQTVCKDPSKSHSDVSLGQRGVKERDVLLEIRGTTQVSLTWNTAQELVVSYPASANVKKYEVDSSPVRVVLKPLGPGP